MHYVVNGHVCCVFIWLEISCHTVLARECPNPAIDELIIHLYVYTVIDNIGSWLICDHKPWEDHEMQDSE